jgi:hypothetical protein
VRESRTLSEDSWSIPAGLLGRSKDPNRQGSVAVRQIDSQAVPSSHTICPIYHQQSEDPGSYTMSGAGYDVVVDVDEEVSPSIRHPSAVIAERTQLTRQQGDLGHTDLQEDLEFHSSNFTTAPSSTSRKIPGGSIGLPAPTTAGSTSSKRFLWTLSFYAQFFDVDTISVLSRCWAALFPRANFLDILEGNPDLYGPFWIATTVVFILFLGGTISEYQTWTEAGHYAYNFKLLSGMQTSSYNLLYSVAELP